MLREKGFRFIFRRGEFKWVHTSLVEDDDVDCTDMDDSEFELFVRSVS